MQITVEGLLILALILVPGAQARIAALRSTPVPWEHSVRSPLEELIDVLLYSMINGLLTVFVLATVAVAYFGHEDQLRRLVRSGAGEFQGEQSLDGFVWLIIYVVVALLIAEVTGSTQLLLRMRTLFATILMYGDKWTHSTIWYWAIDTRVSQRFQDRLVGARVILKDGTLYTGVMGEYPVAADHQPKDFALLHAHRFNAETGEFEKLGPRTILLLNSSDCYSIQVGPGPEQEPIPRSNWELAIQLLFWSFVTLGMSMATYRLSLLPSQDLLIRLLEFFAAQSALWSVLALARIALKNWIPPRWHDIDVQRWWLLSGAAGSLGIVSAMLDSLAVTALSVVGAVFALGQTLRIHVVKAEPDETADE